MRFRIASTLYVRIVFALIVVAGTLGLSGSATAHESIPGYFNDTAIEVRETDDPVQKREILNRKLDAMDRAIDIVHGSLLSTARDDAFLAELQSTIHERSDELAGENGFDRVPDDQIDAFSSYIVQDMEQADTITIGVVTLLLIIIIIILIA